MNEIQALFRVSGPDITEPDFTVTRDGVFVGRTAENALVLNHNKISRQHMRIFWQDGDYWVEDLNSSNGTWVNTVRLRANTPQKLTKGDSIQLGPYALTLAELQSVMPDVATLPEAADLPEAAPLPEAADLPEAAPSPEAAEPAAIPEKKADKAEKVAPKSPDAPKASKPKAPEPAAPDFIDELSEAQAIAMLYRRQGMAPPPDMPLPTLNGGAHHIDGIPRDVSSWLAYLPAIYSQDRFLGRYLLIFESIFNPISWIVDNFDLFLSPEVTPEEWLQWFASWFDVLLVPELPVAQRRTIVQQLGWLFLRRGTRAGLERLLELYFGVTVEILEPKDEPCVFVVKLPLSLSSVKVDEETINRIITSQKPAFAGYRLELS